MATVNVSFQDDLLDAIDNVAKEETRTRSELLREAARLYIERKRRWEAIFSYGKKRALENNITETDVQNEIRAYRREKIRD
jgi:metal-responsive CopG/Arc/MetJ family transcriptional regulator